jgi:iron uptake system component EfeO
MSTVLLAAGCGSDRKSDQAFQAEIVGNMHQLILTQIQALNAAARDLQAAAPLPPDRGWDTTTDQAAIDAMKAAWGRMRTAWEAGEGVLGPLFPMLDGSLDGRYEDDLAVLGAAGDPDPFDGQGVTGMHAIERILYAPVTPPAVVAQESLLPGYQPAAWPATAAQAAELKAGLCAQMVADSQSLIDGWKPRVIDLPTAFDGITALMDEQQEKVRLAASQQEESRYSQRTLGDLRDNLTGTRAVYDLFVPWLDTKPNGASVDAEVQGALARLEGTYGAIPGDAVPPPPPTWSSDTPSVADQQSPFGKLYVSVMLEVDPTYAGSAVDSMSRVALMLGLPPFMPPAATSAAHN